MPPTSKRSAAAAPMVRHLERGRFLRVMITERPQPRLRIKLPLVPAELRPDLLTATSPSAR